MSGKLISLRQGWPLYRCVNTPRYGEKVAQYLDITTEKDTFKDLILSLISTSTNKTKLVEFLDDIRSNQYNSSLEDLHDFAGVQDRQDWAVHCPKNGETVEKFRSGYATSLSQ